MNRFSNAFGLMAISFLMLLAVLPLPVVEAAQIVSPKGPTINIDVSKGLIIRLDRPCSSVFIADPNIADVQLKSPSVLYVLGKSAGETTIYAVDQQDAVLLNSHIEVRQDIDRLQREIRQIDPSGKIHAKAIDDSIVLEGTVKDAATGDDIRRIAARYVGSPTQIVNKLLLSAPNQVDLQVRIAEVQRSVLKQFGINWLNVQHSAIAAFGMVSASPGILPGTLGQTAGGSLVPNVFNTQTPTMLGSGVNNNLFARYHNGNVSINALIDALAQNGLVTLLAEPDLVTVSGKKASFLAGGEFPVPVPQSGTGTAATITIDWKQFGVSLNFTPTILADDRIALHVAPEVSELAPTEGIRVQGITVPGITTRRADTTVELGSGQTFAIAGLLQNQTQQQLQAYPWIGDLPVIGALFRSTAFQRGETEVVILVTPYLVKPVSSATALTTDNDGFYAPPDKDRVLNGNLNTLPQPDKSLVGSPAEPAPSTSGNVDGATPAPRSPVSAPIALPAPTPARRTSVEIKTVPAATLANEAVGSTGKTGPNATRRAPTSRALAMSGFEID